MQLAGGDPGSPSSEQAGVLSWILNSLKLQGP